jgi:hypothetical protein
MEQGPKTQPWFQSAASMQRRIAKTPSADHMQPVVPAAVPTRAVLCAVHVQVAELQDMFPDLSEAAALRALELCNGK